MSIRGPPSENLRNLPTYPHYPIVENQPAPDPNDLFGQVLAASFEVANTLGPGFLEKVYERALKHELTLRGFHVRTQVTYNVIYKDHLVGEYCADLIVNAELAVELKCTELLLRQHLAQCLNYLKASKLKTCLLINFQHAKLSYKRISL